MEELEELEEELDELDEDYINELLNWRPKIIHNKTKQILKGLKISDEMKKSYFIKLKDYHYIDDILELINGSHIILIEKSPKENHKIKSLIYCKYVDENRITCKGYGRFSNFFQIKSNNYFIFQKNTKEEELLCKTAKILFD